MRGSLVALGLVAACSSTDGAGPSPASTAPEPVEQSRSLEAEPDRPAAPKPSPIAPEPTAAVVVADSDSAHYAVQQVLNEGVLPEHANVHFTPIEDPSGVALRAFHAALRHRDEGAKTKVRIAFYGASSVAADRYTAYLRGYLQSRFGDGGIGFVTLVPLWRWHRHDAVRLDANKHWRVEHGQRKEGKLDGLYGLLGASTHSTHRRASTAVLGKASAVSKLADSNTIAIQYLAQPAGGTFTLQLGRGEPTITIPTAADERSVRTHEMTLPESFGPIRIRVSTDDEVRLMGATFERNAPGVVVDALGIGGTRSANMLAWDQPTWTAAIRERSPSLYVLAYGANESVDEDETIETYRANLEAVLDRFAAAVPDASCLLVGPVDYPQKDEDTETWGVRPRVREIIEVQRDVAAARRCGFFDTSKLTGGLGTMPAWVAADPKLARDDHLHLTPLGYTYFGKVLSDALMADYDGRPRVPSTDSGS